MATQSLIPSFEDIKLHSTDEVAEDIVFTLQNEIQAFKDLANPLKCEAKYLPFLAYAFGVDFWDDNLSESDKRNLIQSSLLLHQRKGTVWALERIFESLGMDAKVSEWFDYDGEPYHFKVDIAVSDMNRRISTKLFADLKNYIDIYKNVRSVLDEFSIKLQNATGKIELAGANVINTKLSNCFVQDDGKIEVKTTCGGAIDLKLSNKVGIDYPTTDIKIQGVGIWTI